VTTFDSNGVGASSRAKRKPARFTIDTEGNTVTHDRVFFPRTPAPIRQRYRPVLIHSVCAALLAAFLLLAPLAPSAAAVDPGLEALRARLYCPILAYLKAILAHAPTPRDRYLVVEWKGRDGYYVQCLFYDRDRGLFCEVASGAWERPRVQLVPPGRLPNLAALGFSTKGEKRNFQRRRRVTGPESLAETADTIVRAFREVYGAGANENFTVIAPLVRERPPFGIYTDGKCEDATS